MKKSGLVVPVLLVLLSVVPAVMAEEDLLIWTLVENLADGRSYNYSPNSIRTVEGSIKEVYDGVVDSRSKDVRQLRIDCTARKWAIGETKSWRDGKSVDSPNLSKDGWIWLPIGESLHPKLVEAVCGK
ncbi:MAG: hypothetical protein ACOY4H_10785 [Thermodesulfobacteriota bacterium]